MTANGQVDRPDEILNPCFHGIGTPGRSLAPDEGLCRIETAQSGEFLEVIARYPSVRITFDDGNASDAAPALPGLRRHNLKAVLFVLSDRLDQHGSLSPAEIKSSVQNGMTVGSHGMRHLSWRSINLQELHEELTTSADVFPGAAGQPVRQVACPFGFYDRRVLNAIRRHWLSRVHTVDGESPRNGAWLPSRCTVRANDVAADIEHRVRRPCGSALPGIEYEDAGNVVHTPVWGDEIPFLGAGRPTLDLLRSARAEGAVAALAHPWRRNGISRYQPEWAPLLSAIEVWNRKYDGIAPRREAARLAQQEGVRSFVALDFRTSRQFFPLAMSVSLQKRPTTISLVEAIRAGDCRPEFLGISALRFTRGLEGATLRSLESVRRGMRRSLRRLEQRTAE